MKSFWFTCSEIDEETKMGDVSQMLIMFILKLRFTFVMDTRNTAAEAKQRVSE